MSGSRSILLLLGMLLGCVTSDGAAGIEDLDDSTEDSKADTFGLSDVETVGLLDLVDTADAATLVDIGLSDRAAAAIVAHRSGGLDTFDDLAELDAVPYAGRRVFAALIDHLRAHDLAATVDPATARLRISIPRKMRIAQVPGLVAIAVKDQRVLFARGYGIADFDQQRPVTPDTIFNVASISKTVTATALLQLAERGGFALDDDISAKLGFAARNPEVPNRVITYRMLLSPWRGT